MHPFLTQEAAKIPTFTRFSFVESPRSLLAHLPALRESHFAVLRRIVDGLLVCSSAARMHAREALSLLAEDGAACRSLRVVGEEDDWDGGEGDAEYEGQTLAEWLAPFV